MSTNINRYKPDNDGRLWPASDGEYVLYADHEAALALIPGEAVAWQWRQTYAGRWGNWNDCGLFATDVQKWRDLAEKLPNEVQVRPLYASPAPLPVAVKAPTHRHKKRGSEYTLIGIGKMQAENWEEREYTGTDEPVSGSSVDMREVAIYRSCDDGTFWVRPREEFEDGRFEAIRSALSSPVGGAEEVMELQEQLRAAKWANERDRSTVCDQVNIIKDEIARRSWLCSSRGSYEWDDERYQQEFSAALEIIGKAVDKLSSIASDWSHCPETDAEIQAARASSPTPASDIAALREENERLRDALEKISNAPAWGAPDRWETTPTEVRQLARSALGETPSHKAQLLGYANAYRMQGGSVELGSADIDNLENVHPWAIEFEEHLGIVEIRLLPDTDGKSGAEVLSAFQTVKGGGK